MTELDYLRNELLPKLLKVQQYVDNDFWIFVAKALVEVIASLRARIRGLEDAG